jgi:hypothetical protein
MCVRMREARFEVELVTKQVLHYSLNLFYHVLNAASTLRKADCSLFRLIILTHSWAEGVAHFANKQQHFIGKGSVDAAVATLCPILSAAQEHQGFF